MAGTNIELQIPTYMYINVQALRQQQSSYDSPQQ